MDNAEEGRFSSCSSASTRLDEKLENAVNNDLEAEIINILDDECQNDEAVIKSVAKAMSKAWENGNLRILKDLLRYDKINFHKLFLEVCSLGEGELVHSIITSKLKEKFEFTPKVLCSSLFEVSKCGHKNVLRVFFSNFNPTELLLLKNKDFQLPIMVAAIHGNFSMTKFMFEKSDKISYSMRDKFKCNLIHHLLRNYNEIYLDIVHELDSKLLYQKNRFGQTPLDLVNNEETLKKLIRFQKINTFITPDRNAPKINVESSAFTEMIRSHPKIAEEILNSCYYLKGFGKADPNLIVNVYFHIFKPNHLNELPIYAIEYSEQRSRFLRHLVVKQYIKANTNVYFEILPFVRRILYLLCALLFTLMLLSNKKRYMEEGIISGKTIAVFEEFLVGLFCFQLIFLTFQADVLSIMFITYFCLLFSPILCNYKVHIYIWWPLSCMFMILCWLMLALSLCSSRFHNKLNASMHTCAKVCLITFILSTASTFMLYLIYESHKDNIQLGYFNFFLKHIFSVSAIFLSTSQLNYFSSEVSAVTAIFCSFLTSVLSIFLHENVARKSSPSVAVSSHFPIFNVYSLNSFLNIRKYRIPAQTWFKISPNDTSVRKPFERNKRSSLLDVFTDNDAII